MGRVREHQIAQGQVNTNEDVPINGLWKKSSPKELETLFKEMCLIS